MDYKKIIKNQNLRFKILNFFSWIPDKTMIKIQYRIKTGRKLNLKNPERFTEKIQWYKLYYHNPIMHQCVDKYEVRDFIKSKGLENILSTLYGVYDSPEEIEFEKLPDKFVIKTTSGSGGQNIFICDDKKNLNIVELNQKLKYWLKLNPKKSFGREWAYEGNKNRIIIEELLESDSTTGLIDYKLFCFNGKVEYIYVISDRFLGKSAKLGIYDSDFNKLDAYRCDEEKQTDTISKPCNFDKMIEYACSISCEFPQARIDLYNINGKIYFGEITFYDGSGYMSYSPDEFDYRIGEKFPIMEDGEKDIENKKN